MVELHRQGLSLAQVADVLNAESVPTPAGKARWTKSHVDRLLSTHHAQDVMAELDVQNENHTLADGRSPHTVQERRQ
ncbi:recombinase family protein [Thermomonospora echinospora]|uniref:recombinase family protein n=1 Tax=Thermomonospora echinospora TaxID=1992 RepID=UPI00135A43EA|nr:recombinase family protein [Thermomonospora echinospora]